VVVQQAINAFLCGATKEERRAIMEKHNIPQDVAVAAWNGGRICGQCQHYQPLGSSTYLNGLCMRANRNNYVNPGDDICRDFAKVKGA
jgi:hypothetical protein